MSQPYSLIITPPIDPVNTGYTSALDLSAYIDPNQGKGLDPSDPKFSNKVFSHSLLKHGGTLALEDLQLKELVFPLWLTAATPSLGDALIQRINNAITAPGAVAAWQDIGTSQPTYFDLASAQLDILYDFRRTQGAQWVMACTLRLFSQPLGRVASSSALLATGGATVATGLGPLITFVAGSTIAGDGPAWLDGIVTGASGPLSNTQGNLTAMSVLPDAQFNPLMQLTFSGGSYIYGSASNITTATGGNYVGATAGAGPPSLAAASPFAAATGVSLAPPRYARRYRLLAVARSVGATGTIKVFTAAWAGSQFGTAYKVPVGDWSPVDCGIVSIAQGQGLSSIQTYLQLTGGTPTGPVQVVALYCLPENSTCILTPALAAPVDYGGQVSRLIRFNGAFGAGAGQIYDNGQSQDISSAARGALPQADPKSGPPALAFMCMPVGSPTANPQNLSWSVQVNAQPRTRFVFP